MLPLRRSELDVHQSAWLDSRAFWSALIGPYGCGKTGAGILWAFERSMQNWGRRGLWIEPTFGMIQDIVLPELEEFFEALEFEEVLPGRRELGGMEYRLIRSGRPELELPWGVWMFRSGEVPRRLKGSTVAWCLLDEADQMDEEVENIALSRVRDNHARFLCLGHVGTPEVYGSWLHERCEGDKQQAGDDIIRAKKEDVRRSYSKQYYDRMRDAYDDTAYQQYGEGIWAIKTEGLIYIPPFNDLNVGDYKYRPGWEIYCGMDFNVDPMAFNLCHEVPTTDAKGNVIGPVHLEVFHQYRIVGATSRIAGETLLRDYPNSRITIWCDPAGEGRHTSGLSGTDVAILRNMGFDVHFKRVLRVNDRYNSTRAMLCNARGQRRLMFDRVACKKLIKELQTLTYEEARKAGADNHSTAALDYLTWGRYNPVRRDA